MTQTDFSVDKRSNKKPNKLRNEGLLPANVYGGKGSQAIEMPTKAFEKLYSEVGDTGVVSLVIGEEKRAVMIDEVQTNVLTGDLIHAVFREVSLKEKLTAEVPVEVVGEFKVPDGVLVTVLDQIQVEALPTDIPEKFEIDLEKLTEIGQTITYKDLEFDASKVSLVMGEEGEDTPVLIVQEQKEEEPEPVEEVVEDEGEEGEDGEEKAEGETPETDSKEETPADKKEENDKK